jgi:hypothetical protein
MDPTLCVSPLYASLIGWNSLPPGDLDLELNKRLQG